MMIATVRGRFTDFEGVLEADEDGITRASGAVRVESVNTNK